MPLPMEEGEVWLHALLTRDALELDCLRDEISHAVLVCGLRNSGASSRAVKSRGKQSGWGSF